MATTRSRPSRKSSGSRRTTYRRPARRPVDPVAHSLPGTSLHELALLIGEASRGLSPNRKANDDRLHLRNPLEVAEEQKERLASAGATVQQRVAARIAPNLAAPRLLPLDVVSMVTGIALAATGRYWAVPVAAYGVVALVHNSLARRRYQRSLLQALDEYIEPDLRLIRSDRIRAEGIAARFSKTGDLEFLSGEEAPTGIQMPLGERVLLGAGSVLRARDDGSGLVREAQGKLLVTTARLLFSSHDGLTEMDLDRVVRADVVDELRLVVIPSKRETAPIYIALGNAHALATTINLARKVVSARA
ncbi:MAG TPA: hypothetical protein VF168_00030 [Trueperaceae bacterium]